MTTKYGPRQANLVLIAYASSEGSGEPAHPQMPRLICLFAGRTNYFVVFVVLGLSFISFIDLYQIRVFSVVVIFL